jgi:hypothetical protein
MIKRIAGRNEETIYQLETIQCQIRLWREADDVPVGNNTTIKQEAQKAEGISSLAVQSSHRTRESATHTHAASQYTSVTSKPTALIRPYTLMTLKLNNSKHICF